jgi:flagellar hook-associated protein FlgK
MASLYRKDNERYTVLEKTGDYNFTDSQEQNAVKIYNAIFEASGNTVVVFDWNANFITGFLLQH